MIKIPHMHTGYNNLVTYIIYIYMLSIFIKSMLSQNFSTDMLKIYKIYNVENDKKVVYNIFFIYIKVDFYLYTIMFFCKNIYISIK